MKPLPLAAVALLFLSQPAAADGLADFKRLIEPKLTGSVTYGSAVALGSSGFELRDVVLTPSPDMQEAAKGSPAKPVPIRLKRLAVEDMDFAAAAREQPPDFVRLRAEGIIIGADALEMDMKRWFGGDHLTADIFLDYRNDTQRQIFTLNRLEIDVNGLARLELGFIVDEVKDPWGKDSDGKLRTATIAFQDSSLLGKLIPAIAAEQQMQPDAAIAMGVAMLDLARAGQGPDTLAILDALASFMTDYRQPKGPLRITVNPKMKTTSADFDKITNPNALSDDFGIQVNYAGTVSRGATAAAPAAAGAPKGPAPAAQAPVQTASLPKCAAGQRMFVQAEGAWWAATAREPSASGERCLLRLDGAKGQEVTVPSNQMIVWTIEGPGQAAAACRKGDRVVAFSDGAWYPARVKANAASGKACPVHFEDFDEDEDEDLPLKNIRVLTSR